MKYSVMFCSKSGNTKLLADAIVEALGQTDCAYEGIPCLEGFQAEVIFLGSWTDKGTFDEALLKCFEHCKDKTIALFGTAGFGGSDEYFDAIIQRIEEKLPASCHVVGHYMCQGKMPLGIRKRYEGMLEKDPTNVQFQTFISNFDKALSHPDTDDLKQVKTFACEVMDKLKVK